jgi:hypothetical protein
VPLAIDLTDGGENGHDGGDESFNSKSANKKNTKTDNDDEKNHSTTSVIRKSGRFKKQTSNSYLDNFTSHINKQTKQPKANQNAELPKKKPASRKSNKRKNNKSFELINDDNYSTDLYYNDNSTIDVDEQQMSSRLHYKPPCSLGGKLDDSSKFNSSAAMTRGIDNTAAMAAATTIGGSSAMMTEEVTLVMKFLYPNLKHMYN